MMRRIALSRIALLPFKTSCRTMCTAKAAAAQVSQQAKTIKTDNYKEMNKILKRSYQDEQEDGEIDKDTAEMKSKIMKLFKWEEKPGSSKIVLSRKYGEEHIEVTFDVQETDWIKLNESEQYNPQGHLDNRMFFVVKISKGGNTMVFHAFAVDTMHILNVALVSEKHAKREDFKEYFANISAQDISFKDLYPGPDFPELSETVQAAFYKYLAKRKIDDNLCTALMHYHPIKKINEYLRWLQKLQKFTKQPTKK